MFELRWMLCLAVGCLVWCSVPVSSGYQLIFLLNGSGLAGCVWNKERLNSRRTSRRKGPVFEGERKAHGDRKRWEEEAMMGWRNMAGRGSVRSRDH